MSRELERLLGAPVELHHRSVHRCVDHGNQAAASRWRGLIENTRFFPGEEENSPELAQQFARLGDLYVNDAFGSAHRAHASTEGVARVLKPAVMGFLMEQELRYLGEALDKPKRPFIAVLGGAKISGKIDLIEALLPKVDEILIGGAMACTFFRAMGLETGNSLVEAERVDMARDLMRSAGTKLVLPERRGDRAEAGSGRANARSAAGSDPGRLGDVRRGSRHRRSILRRRIISAGTVVWNGPMGVFETPPFDHGTMAVASAMAAATARGAITVVGGGDSAAAVTVAGLDDKMTHVSTGGGASLEFLEGKVLPGVAALDEV